MKIIKISLLNHDEIGGSLLAGRTQVSSVVAHKSYYIETETSIDESSRSALLVAFAAQGQSAVFGDPPDAWERRPTAEVSYHRGIVDNEQESIRAACRCVGVDVRWSKSATIYSCDSEADLAKVLKLVVNPSIETIERTSPTYDTLRPSGEYEPPGAYDLRSMTDADLEEVGRANGRNLTLRQMTQLRDTQASLGLLTVTDVLLESVDARWSDHCYHTTWKSAGDLLAILQAATEDTNNPNIVSAFVDNSGVWRLYDGWAVAIKAETHNGPTAIAPYFGQLTKLGGVLRDILGTGRGADPFAVYEYTATGMPDLVQAIPGVATPLEVCRETVRAISEYGNTFGAPMAWSRMDFHPRYGAKPFALGGALGLVPERHAQRQAAKPGDYVVLIGGLTGNDGIHGASGSSAGSSINATSVQIGAPLEEVKFREALLELRDSNCVRALTDLGAAGLNSACGEMGDPVGVWVNTAMVPLKVDGLAMWRVLLSESQERMLLAVTPDQLRDAFAILSRHYVPHAAVGRFDGSGRFTVFHDPAYEVDERTPVEVNLGAIEGDIGFSIPYAELIYKPEQLPITRPSMVPSVSDEVEVDEPAVKHNLGEVLASLRVCSQQSLSSRYDSTVRGDTVHGPKVLASDDYPCAYFACTPVEGKPFAVLLSTFFDPYLAEADPIEACRHGFVAAVSRLRWAGVRLEDIALCDNFYTPHKSPQCFDILAAMVDALADLSRATGVPFISGKDSSAGSSETPDGWHHVPHSVFLSAIGKSPEVAGLRTNQWSDKSSTLLLAGPKSPGFAGTVAADVLHLGRERVDHVSTSSLVQYLRAIPEAAVDILSFLPVEAGGLAATLARASIAYERCVELSPELKPCELFCEDRMCAIVEVLQPAGEVSPLDGLDVTTVGRLLGNGVGVRYRDRDLLDAAMVSTWRSRLDERLAL